MRSWSYGQKRKTLLMAGSHKEVYSWSVDLLRCKQIIIADRKSAGDCFILFDKLEFIKFIFYINNVKLFRLLVCICFLFRKGLHSNLLGLQTSSNQPPQRLPSIFQHLHKDKTSDHPSNLDNAPSNNYNRVLKNCIVHHS